MAASAASAPARGAPAAASARLQSQSAQLMAYFTELGSLDGEARVAGVVGLLRHLRAAQADFERETARLQGAGARQAAADARPCCNDLNYALQRLARGLCSPRPGARQGYALALAEALAHFPNLRTSDVLARVAEATAVHSSTDRGEVRDLLLGRLFAYAALCRAAKHSAERD